MNKISKSKIAGLAVIVGMMMAASSVFANVHAAPTTVLNGRGTGTYTCADGTENTDLGFFISVNKEKGKTSQFKLSGSWSIFPQGGFDSGIQGNIYGGKIGKTSYSLLSVDQYHFGIVCPNDATPSKGTVTGQCGQGVNIEFKSENGGHGTFTGNIVCY